MVGKWLQFTMVSVAWGIKWFIGLCWLIKDKQDKVRKGRESVVYAGGQK